MAYGNGSIEKSGGNSWRITWYAGGKRFRRTIRGAKSDARRELRQEVAKADHSWNINTRHVLVGELLDDLVADYRASGKNVQTCQWRVNRLRPFFGSLRADWVSSDTIREYTRTRRRDGVKDWTISCEIALLRRAFTLGSRHTPRKVREVPYMPKAGPPPEPRQGFFEHDEFLRVRSHLPAESAQLVTFLYHTGCRKDEARTLRWDNVILQEGRIRLTKTKNKRPRVIPLTAEVRAMLESLRAERDQLWPESPWVFSRNGRAIHVKTLGGQWQRAREQAGLPGVLIHDLRRTAARNLRRSGVPEHTIMEMGGWRTRRIFEQYDIVDATDLDRAADLLDRYLFQIEAAIGAGETVQ